MLKKRLVGVVTVRNGWAVQSFGYRRYLPLGKPECLVENLDRWGADEILVIEIDRSSAQSGPNFALLERLAQLGLSTPLIYGGGIRSVEDGVRVIQSGADRLSVDALMHDAPQVVAGLSDRLGAQAIIASLPMRVAATGLQWVDYRGGRTRSIDGIARDLIAGGVVSETLVIDCDHEGSPDAFDRRLVELFPVPQVPLIVFGGLSEPAQMGAMLDLPAVKAVGVGNFLSYREHALQTLKRALAGMPLRQARYESNHTLLTDD